MQFRQKCDWRTEVSRFHSCARCPADESQPGHHVDDLCPADESQPGHHVDDLFSFDDALIDLDRQRFAREGVEYRQRPKQPPSNGASETKSITALGWLTPQGFALAPAKRAVE
jgi:hypothetical protein